MNDVAATARERAAPLRANALAALAAGTLAAAVAAVPAALRVQPSPASWLVLAGAASLVLGPSLAGLSRTRPLNVALFAVLSGLGLAAVPVAFVASRLQSLTHHRPLGAVTAAVIAALLALGFVALSLRLTTWSRARQGRAWVRSALALLALGGPALLIGSVLSAPAARASALDVGLALACAAVLGSSPWPAPLVRVASRAGLPVWVAVVGSGLVLGLTSAGAAARAASPALFAPFGWFVQ